MKVVIDTNIFISFLLTPDKTIRKILIAWEKKLFKGLMTREQFEEIARVCCYPKILQKIRLEDVKALLDIIEKDAKWITLKKIPRIVKKDPKDDKIIACFRKGKADYIITGDNHLLRGNFKNVNILSPKNFLEILEKNNKSPEKYFFSGPKDLSKKVKSIYK